MRTVRSNPIVNLSPASKPSVKGWCPGALRPMLSGDGLVVRIRPRSGRLSQTQAAGIAALADRYGNGMIDITSRANLQLRGVQPAAHTDLIDGLRLLELVDPSQEVEERRNLVVTPFWNAGDSTQDIAAALAAALSQPDAPALPAKFGFAVDTGEHPVLQHTSGDIRIERTSTGLVVRADGFATCARVTPGEAVPMAMALARWYQATLADSPHKCRMADLASRQQLPDAFQTPLREQSAPPPVRIGPRAIGWLVGIEFGQMSAQTLLALAGHPGSGALRISPWRMLLIEGASHAPDAPGLITCADDPLLRVVACTGAPACLQAAIATRPLARWLAPYVPVDALLHVSGCAKGCAHQNAALTLVGTEGGINLIRHGNASSKPDVFALSADTLPTELQRLLHAIPI
jgi:precorrin-3B synthase